MCRTPGGFPAIGALCLAILCSANCARADENTLEFDPPLSVSIRQTNGATARGKLLSITAEELALRAVNGKEVTLKLEKVRVIKNSNSTFEYLPNDETFADLCKRADKLPNATWKGPAAEAARAAQLARGPRTGQAADPNDPAARRGDRPRAGVLPTGNDILAPGRAGVAPGTTVRRAQIDRDRDRGLPRRDPAAEEEPATDDTPADPPAPGSTVYSCSSCMRDLPASFRSGDTCPHCGEIAVFEEDSAESAAKDEPKLNPFVPSGPATVPAPVAPVSAAVPQAAGGLSISEVPLLVKIAIFLGLVAVGWIVLQRR